MTHAAARTVKERILTAYRAGDPVKAIAIDCRRAPSYVSQVAQDAGLRRHARRGSKIL